MLSFYLLIADSCKDACGFTKTIQTQILQVEFMAKRLTQNDLKKEEAGQALEHKDYYFLASVEFLKQSEGRKIINIKYSPILTYYFISSNSLYLFTILPNILFEDTLNVSFIIFIP